MRNLKMSVSVKMMLVGLLCLTVAACANDRQPDPFNQIVIMIDGSGSYRNRQMEAISKATSLLDSLAQTKVRRWEESNDRVTIISLDAVPEALWQGNLAELKKLKQADWAARFKSRTDYASCTDVAAAFQLAAGHLDGDPRYVDKFLFAFSDLIHEPPTSSIGKCQAATKPSLPSEEFSWDAFRNVSVSVFWVPPDQKLAWQRAVAEHNLASSFALYTTSESAQVKIQPPARATLKISDEEREVQKAGIVSGIVKALVGLLILFLVIGIVIWLLMRKPRRLNRQVHPSVPPLPLRARRPGQLSSPQGRPVPRRPANLPDNRQR
jgi:hypothetical protein